MSSRNDDQKTPPEKENDAGSSFDHMDDIELGRVSPPTELDLSRLNETKIAKREMEKNKPIRPDWLWEKRADGSYEYWTREKVVIRAYIDHLERSAGDARRKMDGVIFTLQGKTGTASKRAEYAVEQITKIMAMLDVEPVVKHEPPCIWPNDDRVKCNGHRDGNCAMPIRREEICKDIPKDTIGEEGEELAPKEKRHPAILDGPEIAIRGEINRADGPKSPCCGVAMVWINAKQHHICPNCGKIPGNKKCECHEGKSLGPGWPKCPYCGGELYTEEPVKCCKCSKIMDDPEGWVEGLNNHMWCPSCQPPEEPETRLETLDIKLDKMSKPPVTYAEPERIPPSKGRVWKEPPEDVGRPQSDAVGGTEEPTTVLCPQCKQPVNRTYDHVKGGIGESTYSHYECPEPSKEPVLPPNFKMAPEYPPEEPYTVTK